MNLLKLRDENPKKIRPWLSVAVCLASQWTVPSIRPSPWHSKQHPSSPGLCPPLSSTLPFFIGDGRPGPTFNDGNPYFMGPYYMGNPTPMMGILMGSFPIRSTWVDEFINPQKKCGNNGTWSGRPYMPPRKSTKKTPRNGFQKIPIGQQLAQLAFLGMVKIFSKGNPTYPGCPRIPQTSPKSHPNERNSFINC